MIRIIPRLDIKGPNLVKGVQLEGLRVLGKPEEFARHYYEAGADELLYIDVVATLYGRNSLLDLVSATSREIFIPLIVGGGLRDLGDMRAALLAGADKIAVNTAAVRRPELVREAAQRFGSSTVVVSIEAQRRPEGGYEAYTDNGRERTGVDAVAWARRAADLGAGEILLTAVEREGTGAGVDLELARGVADAVPIPVIVSGGVGSVADVRRAVLEGHADAVAIASVLHYERVRALDGNGTAGALGRHAFSRVEPATIAAIKADLLAHGVECRTATEALAHG